jgi:hypothetical protein
MSWHCVGPGRGPPPGAGAPPNIFAIIAGKAARNAALSAPVAAPPPWFAFATLSSIGLLKLSGNTIGMPCMSMTNAPLARPSSAAFFAFATSSGDSP